MGYKRVPKLAVRLYRTLHPKVKKVVPNAVETTLASNEEGGVVQPDFPTAVQDQEAIHAVIMPSFSSNTWTTWWAATAAAIATAILVAIFH